MLRSGCIIPTSLQFIGHLGPSFAIRQMNSTQAQEWRGSRHKDCTCRQTTILTAAFTLHPTDRFTPDEICNADDVIEEEEDVKTLACIYSEGASFAVFSAHSRISNSRSCRHTQSHCCASPQARFTTVIFKFSSIYDQTLECSRLSFL